MEKKDVVEFYQEISDVMLPHLEERPVVVQRYTEGVEKDGFYQQEIPDYYPDWIDRIEVERKEKGKQSMLELHTKSALKYVNNQDGICFHTWQSKKEHLNKPDLMIYDLDPPGDDFSAVIEVAKVLKKEIEGFGGTPFVMTTGSSGMHVVVPIHPDKPYEEIREMAKKIAAETVEKHPGLATINVRKDQRDKKVFLDYLRNSYGQTTICPYSLRSKKNATVATPLLWEELDEKGIHSQSFHAMNIFKRLSQIEDPWKEIHSHRCML